MDLMPEAALFDRDVHVEHPLSLDESPGPDVVIACREQRSLDADPESLEEDGHPRRLTDIDDDCGLVQRLYSARPAAPLCDKFFRKAEKP